MPPPSRNFSKVIARSQSAGLSQLALTFVLPHEHKPMRLPVVPATLTALLDVMSDDTIPVPDNTTRRAFLCRDPAYPLWVERSLTGMSNYIAGTFALVARVNEIVPVPIWETQYTVTASPKIDGKDTSAGPVADLFVLGQAPGTQSIFIPPGTNFSAWIGSTGGAPIGSSVKVDVIYQVGGEEFTSTISMVPNTATDYSFTGTAGTDTVSYGNLIEGIVPYGFCYFTNMRTGPTTGPTGSGTARFFAGWSTSSGMTPYISPTGTLTAFVPFSMPPEFNNSVLPYGRTRLNSSAALFTNVTAALSKEGTVLAARLKPSVVDPWNFTASHINSVHPTLRYFGPLEKGLYTFTTPSGNVDSFNDHWITMPSSSTFNPTCKPLFDHKDIGLYNAVLLSDLGSSSSGTQMAVSSYAYIEFETTSSLFVPGVSTLTLEVLHAAEVALLSFGHFHENPLHWAALKSAAMGALRIVGPMVAPYVQQAGQALLNRGVQYLSGKAGGDRKMSQAQLTQPKNPPSRQKKARVAQKKKKK